MRRGPAVGSRLPDLHQPRTGRARLNDEQTLPVRAAHGLEPLEPNPGEVFKRWRPPQAVSDGV